MTRAIPFGDGLKDIKGKTLEKQTNGTLQFGGKSSVDNIKINRRKREMRLNQETVSERVSTDETKTKKDVKPLYVEVKKKQDRLRPVLELRKVTGIFSNYYTGISSDRARAS